jgi:DNA-binding MarR family transcriptional regulator
MSSPTSVPPVGDAEFVRLLEFRDGLRRFLRWSEDQAKAVGLTPSQHQLLLAVRVWEGGASPSTSDLADELQLKLHSVVELAQRAEAAGLVERSVDPVDGRRQLVSLTPLGSKKLASLSLLHRDELRRFRAEMVDVLRELE